MIRVEWCRKSLDNASPVPLRIRSAARMFSGRSMRGWVRAVPTERVHAQRLPPPVHYTHYAATVENEGTYSVEQAAKLLNRTPGRIRQLLRSGELEGCHEDGHPSRPWRIPPRWMATLVNMHRSLSIDSENPVYPGRIPVEIPGAIQEDYNMMRTLKAPQKAEKKELRCVHPYILQWSGKCEGCRKTPLSPNLPDYHLRATRITTKGPAPEKEMGGSTQVGITPDQPEPYIPPMNSE